MKKIVIEIAIKITTVVTIVTLNGVVIGTRQQDNAANVMYSQDVTDTNNFIEVDSTAYYDVNNYGHGADGRPLVEGLTLAGKREWLGMSAMLYDSDMNLLGIYEFRDTGYGQSTGQGNSTILKGKSVGTIENGTCIDVYFDTYEKCKRWGRRKVYMQLVKAVG